MLLLELLSFVFVFGRKRKIRFRSVSNACTFHCHWSVYYQTAPNACTACTH